MNRKVGIIIIVVIVIVLIIGLFRLNASSEEPKLSKEEIKEVILTQYPGEIRNLSFYGDSDDAYYQAEVVNGMNEYSLKLDGKTAEILEIEKKTTSVNEKQNKPEEKKPVKQEEASSKNDEEQENKNKKKNAVIDVNKVREIALSQFSGEIVELELDEDDGRKIYEVKIENGDDEAEIEIDAYTGEIIVIDIDREDNDDDDD